VIAIDTERCDGCGVCVDACATGAIYLVTGKAAVDDALCQDFREKMATGTAACVAACPAEAIVLTEPAPLPQQDVTRVPARRPEPEVVVVGTDQMPVPMRAKVLPLLGAAITWAGREIVPRLADHLLQNLDRQATNGRAAATGSSNGSASHEGQKGRRHRRRRRGS
jgi:Fe-S-cluster-containing dehydrogenase component